MGCNTVLWFISATGYTTTNINSFEWRLFLVDNPNQVLETQITPGNMDYVGFVMPRVVGEYGVKVKINYYDKESVNSRDIVQ
jgi:hypothetical protein